MLVEAYGIVHSHWVLSSFDTTENNLRAKRISPMKFFFLKKKKVGKTNNIG